MKVRRLKRQLQIVLTALEEVDPDTEVELIRKSFGSQSQWNREPLEDLNVDQNQLNNPVTVWVTVRNGD